MTHLCTFYEMEDTLSFLRPGKLGFSCLLTNDLCKSFYESNSWN